MTTSIEILHLMMILTSARIIYFVLFLNDFQHTKNLQQKKNQQKMDNLNMLTKEIARTNQKRKFNLIGVD